MARKTSPDEKPLERPLIFFPHLALLILFKAWSKEIEVVHDGGAQLLQVSFSKKETKSQIILTFEKLEPFIFCTVLVKSQ